MDATYVDKIGVEAARYRHASRRVVNAVHRSIFRDTSQFSDRRTSAATDIENDKILSDPDTAKPPIAQGGMAPVHASDEELSSPARRSSHLIQQVRERDKNEEVLERNRH